MIRHHHERWDGMGYPDGLVGDDIPYTARVLAVADAFDAMTSTRPYRTAGAIERAISELKAGRGTQFDSDIVDTFVDLLESGVVSVPDPAERIA